MRLLPLYFDRKGIKRFWNNFCLKYSTAMSLCSPTFQCVSFIETHRLIRAQHGLLGSPLDLEWPWPKVKFLPRSFKVSMHMFRRWHSICIHPSETRWNSIFPLTCFVQKLFAKKAFVKPGCYDLPRPVESKLLKLAQRNCYQILGFLKGNESSFFVFFLKEKWRQSYRTFSGIPEDRKMAFHDLWWS